MDVSTGNPYQRVVQANQSEQLILDHLHYVRHVLGRTVAELPEGVDFENLQAAGILGLVEAANQFDPSRNVSFTTFAHTRIRGAILDELRRNCPLSRKLTKHWELIRTAYSELPAPVSPEDLAAATGLSIDEVLDCLDAIRLANPESWHDELAPGSRSDGEELPPDRAIERDEELQMLTDSIQELPDQQRTVLTLYHMEELRLKEIGKAMNLSESRISRVLTTAELRLKESMRRRLRHDAHQLHDRRVHYHAKHTAQGSSRASEPRSAS